MSVELMRNGKRVCEDESEVGDNFDAFRMDVSGLTRGDGVAAVVRRCGRLDGGVASTLRLRCVGKEVVGAGRLSTKLNDW